MDFSGQTVLVTGGSGFVGSRIAARLAANGARVRAIVRTAADHPGLGAPNIVQLTGEFMDPTIAAEGCAGADIVIHAAATAGADVERVRHVNVDGTTVLSAAARAAGCRCFVHISTISVYDRSRDDQRLTEDSPLKRTGDPYGVTKAGADRVIECEMTRGLTAVILRPGAILGVHPTSTWAVRMPSRVREGKVPLRIDGRDLLPWVHVEDLVDSVERAIDNAHLAAGRAYNLVDGHATWLDYVETTRRWFPGCPSAPVTPREQVKPGEYSTGGIEATRVREELGHVPVRTWEQGMDEAAAWWRAH